MSNNVLWCFSFQEQVKNNSVFHESQEDKENANDQVEVDSIHAMWVGCPLTDAIEDVDLFEKKFWDKLEQGSQTQINMRAAFWQKSCSRATSEQKMPQRAA